MKQLFCSHFFPQSICQLWVWNKTLRIHTKGQGIVLLLRNQESVEMFHGARGKQLKIRGARNMWERQGENWAWRSWPVFPSGNLPNSEAVWEKRIRNQAWKKKASQKQSSGYLTVQKRQRLMFRIIRGRESSDQP